MSFLTRPGAIQRVRCLPAQVGCTQPVRRSRTRPLQGRRGPGAEPPATALNPHRATTVHSYAYHPDHRPRRQRPQHPRRSHRPSRRRHRHPNTPPRCRPRRHPRRRPGRGDGSGPSGSRREPHGMAPRRHGILPRGPHRLPGPRLHRPRTPRRGPPGRGRGDPLPGAEELALLRALRDAALSEAYDLLVVDLPPTPTRSPSSPSPRNSAATSAASSPPSGRRPAPSARSSAASPASRCPRSGSTTRQAAGTSNWPP